MIIAVGSLQKESGVTSFVTNLALWLFFQKGRPVHITDATTTHDLATFTTTRANRLLARQLGREQMEKDFGYTMGVIGPNAHHVEFRLAMKEVHATHDIIIDCGHNFATNAHYKTAMTFCDVFICIVKPDKQLLKINLGLLNTMYHLFDQEGKAFPKIFTVQNYTDPTELDDILVRVNDKGKLEMFPHWYNTGGYLNHDDDITYAFERGLSVFETPTLLPREQYADIFKRITNPKIIDHG